MVEKPGRRKQPKRIVEWQAIGLAFCGGIEPVADIARKHGVATCVIYHKAKREGWSRGMAKPAVKPVRRGINSGKRGSRYAMRRMIGLVNRLTDELSAGLDQAGASDTPPAEQKFVADMLTSLTRALEKLTALEREISKQMSQDREQIEAGANDASIDSWDELQRRLAGIAAASAAEPDSEGAAAGSV